MSMRHSYEIGVLFWAGHDPEQTLSRLTALGVRTGQLGIPGNLDLERARAWKPALNKADMTVYTVVAAFEGEDYADIPTVRRTVGFVPPATRAEREKRACDVSDFAAWLGAESISMHIGCVPEDKSDPDYVAVRDMVRRVCEHAEQYDQLFALETGQETAEALRAFIRDVDRYELVVNFDPANMILYGMGDPMEALKVIGEYVKSVHCKDAVGPPKNSPGALGTEKPLGQGDVGMRRLLWHLHEANYRGPLTIERETHDPDQRLRDIETGIKVLRDAKLTFMG